MNNTDLLVAPHQAPLAEKALIGCLMFGRVPCQRARAAVSEADFASDVNRTIFKVAVELLDGGGDVDAITVIEALRRQGKLGDVGGGEYIDECYRSVVTEENVGEYARVVRWCALDAKIKLQVIATAHETTPEQVSVLGELILSQKSLSVSGFLDFRTDLGEAWEAYLAKQKPGVDTGFAEIDAMLQKLHPGQVMTIGARAGAGKTAIMTRIMLHVAEKAKEECCYLTTEMSKEEMLCRVLPIVSGVPAYRINAKKLESEDFRKIGDAMADRLAKLPIKVYANNWPRLEDVQAAAIQSKCRIFFLDYLQRCRLPDGRKGEPRTYQIADFMRRLKSFAQDSGISVVMGCQLNRRRDKEKEPPTMSDLSDSGSVENESDKIGLLWEREFQDAKPPAGNKSLEWIMAKNRRGPSGANRTAKLQLDTRLVDMLALNYETFDEEPAAAATTDDGDDEWYNR